VIAYVVPAAPAKPVYWHVGFLLFLHIRFISQERAEIVAMVTWSLLGLLLAFGSYRWTAFYLAGGGERERKEREKKGGGKERKRRGKVQNVALQLGVQ
jgi:hypothetical protein